MEFAIAFIIGVATFILVRVNVSSNDPDDTEMQKLVRIAVGKMIAAVIAASSIFMALMLLKTYVSIAN